MIFDSVIRLRKDTEANFNKVKASYIPESGEVCLVETDLYGIRTKVGDGINTFEDLPYTDTVVGAVVVGYLMNDNFYTDSTYQVQYEKNEHHIYIDRNSNYRVLTWDGTTFHGASEIATETLAGVMKLYQEHGQNSDGTMSQKAITDAIGSIGFVVSGTDADGEADCLELNVPW